MIIITGRGMDIHERMLRDRDERIAALTRERDNERREVRRLTDLVIRMKREGHSATPADQHWGSYVMRDEDALARENETRSAESNRDTDDVDGQVLAAIEAELDLDDE